MKDLQMALAHLECTQGKCTKLSGNIGKILVWQGDILYIYWINFKNLYLSSSDTLTGHSGRFHAYCKTKRGFVLSYGAGCHWCV